MLTVLFYLLSVVSFAQDHQEDADPHHDSVIHVGPIDVHGEREEVLNAVPAVANLHGDELLKRSEGSIGETLKNEVGVNSSQFGPAASRPIIRGLEGDRIRILQNGVGVLDASGTSQDHAVPVNPLSAESVEIVRGPINLIYGSSAMGGVVNIVNSRIHKNYFPGILSTIDTKFESVNQGTNTAAKLDYGTDNFMMHFDGNYLKADDLQTPLGKIANSQTEQHGLAAGTTYFFKEKNYLGLSYSTFQNIYGVVSEQDVEITLKQQRLDFASYFQLSGFFKALQIKSAQTFYKHTEFENGVAGTVFNNTGNETRLELVQDKRGRWSGLMGAQITAVDFVSRGAEAFLPTAHQQSIAPFVYEELDLQPVQLSAAVRGEFNNLEANSGPVLAQTQKRDFTALSSALSSKYNFTETWATSLQASLNQRAPNYQELYANGPHLAVGIFEQGDKNLNVEKSFGVEWSLQYKAKTVETFFTLFNQEYANFITLTSTGQRHDTDESGTVGDSDEDFLIYRYSAQKARINGAEWKLSYRALSYLKVVLMADYLRGDNLQLHRPLPRISPVRTGVELQFEKERWQSNLEWRRVFAQDRVAANETSTPSYNLANFMVAYNLPWGENQLRLYGQANNFTDEIARNHVSVIKDRVLLPGRNFVVGARLIF